MEHIYKDRKRIEYTDEITNVRTIINITRLYEDINEHIEWNNKSITCIIEEGQNEEGLFCYEVYYIDDVYYVISKAEINKENKHLIR